MARLTITIEIELDDGDPPATASGSAPLATTVAHRARIAAAEATAAAEAMIGAAISALETAERDEDAADVRTLTKDAIEVIKRRILAAPRSPRKSLK